MKSTLFWLVLISSTFIFYSHSNCSSLISCITNGTENTNTSSPTTIVKCPRIPPNLTGAINITKKAPPSIANIENHYRNSSVSNDSGDGHFKPLECEARNRVAIIVPYRDRASHLRVLLYNLHSFLRKQQLDYAIFVVEQVANQTFNRGKLMNVGYVEASRLYEWDCFIFHDVDLIPENDNNLYWCPEAESPRHMSVAIDKYDYQLPYSTLFGGISALTWKQFERLHGFSNDYWGWGGEDDDFSTRVRLAGYTIARYPTSIARYHALPHKTSHAGEANPVNECRYTLMRKTHRRWKKDGLFNLDYRLLAVTKHPLYIHFRVDLLEKESRKSLKNLCDQ